jgi:hypothetical protein
LIKRVAGSVFQASDGEEEGKEEGLSFWGNYQQNWSKE